MKKTIVIGLALSLLIVGQSQSAFAKEKTTPTKTAEDKCVKDSAKCLRTCNPPLKGSAVQQCEKQCGDRANSCLNKVTISVDPATPKQTVKQNPAAQGQSTTPNKGGVDKQGTQKSGDKK